MKRLTTIVVSLSLLSATSSLMGQSQAVSVPGSQKTGAEVVRMAKLEIDPAQLESYKVALKEEIETSVRVEPGVLGLYAVSEKDNSAHITILEMYADEKAYKAHLETPHFKKYKAGTQQMVKSLTLMETNPVILSMKPK